MVSPHSQTKRIDEVCRGIWYRYHRVLEQWGLRDCGKSHSLYIPSCSYHVKLWRHRMHHTILGFSYNFYPIFWLHARAIYIEKINYLCLDFDVQFLNNLYWLSRILTKLWGSNMTFSDTLFAATLPATIPQVSIIKTRFEKRFHKVNS
jgi:hypothetical protein